MTQQSTLTALDSSSTSFTPLQTPDIEHFWQLEHIGIKDPPAVNDNDQAMSAFSSSVSMQEGRYEVAWPWKDYSPTIQDNFSLAYGRMKFLACRQSQDRDLCLAYDEILLCQKKNGIIELVPEEEESPGATVTHYLPH